MDVVLWCSVKAISVKGDRSYCHYVKKKNAFGGLSDFGQISSHSFVIGINQSVV